MGVVLPYVCAVVAGILVGHLVTHRWYLRRLSEMKLDRVEALFTQRTKVELMRALKCTCGHSNTMHSFGEGGCWGDISCQCTEFVDSSQSIGVGTS